MAEGMSRGGAIFALVCFNPTAVCPDPIQVKGAVCLVRAARARRTEESWQRLVSRWLLEVFRCMVWLEAGFSCYRAKNNLFPIGGNSRVVLGGRLCRLVDIATNLQELYGDTTWIEGG